MRSRYRSVGIVTGWTIGVLGFDSCRNWEFFSSPLRPDRFYCLHNQLYNGYVALFQGKNGPRREADDSPPSRS